MTSERDLTGLAVLTFESVDCRLVLSSQNSLKIHVGGTYKCAAQGCKGLLDRIGNDEILFARGRLFADSNNDSRNVQFSDEAFASFVPFHVSVMGLG